MASPDNKITDNKKINDLISQDLIELKKDTTKWCTLYKSRSTNEYWEKYYPYPESHGDGPPELRSVTPEYAKDTYGIE